MEVQFQTISISNSIYSLTTMLTLGFALKFLSDEGSVPNHIYLKWCLLAHDYAYSGFYLKLILAWWFGFLRITR